LQDLILGHQWRPARRVTARGRWQSWSSGQNHHSVQKHQLQLHHNLILSLRLSSTTNWHKLMMNSLNFCNNTAGSDFAAAAPCFKTVSRKAWTSWDSSSPKLREESKTGRLMVGKDPIPSWKI
jgi:hypothetical protein